MKFKFLTVILAVMLALASFTACDIGLKDKAYEPTDIEYFEFSLRADGETYAISKKDGATLPESIKLPATFTAEDGTVYPVVEVKAEGFKGENLLKSVTIPTGYTVIGMHAFISCESLETLVIGISQGRETSDGLVIGNGAFQNCSLNATVTLGSCIKVIEDYAFSGTKISSILLNRVEKIGYMSFGECLSLSKFYIPATLVDIDGEAFKGSVNVKFSISSKNAKYKIEDNKIVEK